DWPAYLSPIAAGALPIGASTFMHLIGIVEMAVGVVILAGYTRLGGYVAAAWLAGIAVNLVASGRFFDVAVRDVAMAIGAFTLARLTEAGVGATASERRPAGTNRLITAALVIAAVPLASVGHVAASDHRGHSSTSMSAAATLHQNMRALWSD